MPRSHRWGSRWYCQGLLLACIFVSIAACTDTLYVLAAGALGPKIIAFGGGRSYGRYVTARLVHCARHFLGLQRFTPPLNGCA